MISASDILQGKVLIVDDMEANVRLLESMLRGCIDTGAVVAGVIGKRNFLYDFWSNVVNTANRAESRGVCG